MGGNGKMNVCLAPIFLLAFFLCGTVGADTTEFKIGTGACAKLTEGLCPGQPFDECFVSADPQEMVQTLDRHLVTLFGQSPSKKLRTLAGSIALSPEILLGFSNWDHFCEAEDMRQWRYDLLAQMRKGFKVLGGDAPKPTKNVDCGEQFQSLFRMIQLQEDVVLQSSKTEDDWQRACLEVADLESLRNIHLALVAATDKKDETGEPLILAYSTVSAYSMTLMGTDILENTDQVVAHFEIGGNATNSTPCDVICDGIGGYLLHVHSDGVLAVIGTVSAPSSFQNGTFTRPGVCKTGRSENCSKVNITIPLFTSDDLNAIADESESITGGGGSIGLTIAIVATVVCASLSIGVLVICVCFCQQTTTVAKEAESDRRYMELAQKMNIFSTSKRIDRTGTSMYKKQASAVPFSPRSQVPESSPKADRVRLIPEDHEAAKASEGEKHQSDKLENLIRTSLRQKSKGTIGTTTKRSRSPAAMKSLSDEDSEGKSGRSGNKESRRRKKRKGKKQYSL
ncbi:unnamed protein product [Cyprideis torosa]|uniref:Uncharacterized protein n=1 Tax=Cyprideis torosa TaxID=163714 RepID=A0A7R8ZR87_9CRUS|nr:unnamed protein product [Cyprideis torosa]CAG0898328.1 unnamed protein product [Cyprideis torosa]